MPLPRVAAVSAEELQEQQKPWLEGRLLPLASVAQPQVGLVLSGSASQDDMGKFAPVLMIACAKHASTHALYAWRCRKSMLAFECLPAHMIYSDTVLIEEGRTSVGW